MGIYVAGTNEIRVKAAEQRYREVWKSKRNNLSSIEHDLAGERKAIRDYTKHLESISDPKVRAVIEEIIRDEQNHEHNLQQVLKYLQGDKTALTKLEKSEGG